jgi:hypothetical protein
MIDALHKTTLTTQRQQAPKISTMRHKVISSLPITIVRTNLPAVKSWSPKTPHTKRNNFGSLMPAQKVFSITDYPFAFAILACIETAIRALNILPITNFTKRSRKLIPLGAGLHWPQFGFSIRLASANPHHPLAFALAILTTIP